MCDIIEANFSQIILTLKKYKKMNLLKKILHRAAQTAIIAFFSAIFINFFAINFPYHSANPVLTFEWGWIVNAVIVSTAVAIMYINAFATPKVMPEDESEMIMPNMLAVLLTLALTITDSFLVTRKNSVPVCILIASGVILLSFGLFSKRVGKSVGFGLFFSGMIGIFDWMHYPSWYEGLGTLGASIIVIFSARIIRTGFIYLFMKEHSYMKKVVENGNAESN